MWAFHCSSAQRQSVLVKALICWFSQLLRFVQRHSKKEQPLGTQAFPHSNQTTAQRNHKNVRAMILLAPGFGLNRRWHELLGQSELQRWREEGSIEVFHYLYSKHVPLKYEFILDAENYSTDDLHVSVPTLVIHGLADTVVPSRESENFHRHNPDQVELHLLESDHCLTDVLDEMSLIVENFLNVHRLLPEHREHDQATIGRRHVAGQRASLVDCAGFCASIARRRRALHATADRAVDAGNRQCVTIRREPR